MIDDLDRSLEDLLKRELPASLFTDSQVSISFLAPDQDFPPAAVTLPAIDVFLYDVRENTSLRSNEWMEERAANGTVTRRRAPTRVDCSYLITAWSSSTSPTRAQDEHRLLGEVMRVLLRHPTLPEAVLQGSLKGQQPPLPSSTLQAGQLQSLSELWQALGGKPRATLNCTITVGVEALAPVEAGPPVIERRLRLRHGTKTP